MNIFKLPICSTETDASIGDDDASIGDDVEISLISLMSLNSLEGVYFFGVSLAGVIVAAVLVAAVEVFAMDVVSLFVGASGAATTSGTTTVRFFGGGD